MKACKGCGQPVPVTGIPKYDRHRVYCSVQCNKRTLNRKLHEKRQKLLVMAECDPHRCRGCGAKINTLECRACALMGVESG